MSYLQIIVFLLILWAVFLSYLLKNIKQSNEKRITKSILLNVWAPRAKKSSYLVLYFPSLPIYRSSFKWTCKVSPGPSVRKHVQSLALCEPLLSQFHWAHLIVKVLPSREKKRKRKKENWRSAKGSLQSRSEPGGLKNPGIHEPLSQGAGSNRESQNQSPGWLRERGGDLLESALYLLPLSHACTPSAILGLRLIDSAK